MWTAVPLLVALATFAAYVFLGNTLDVANALTSLALFDILRFPLFMLPQVVNNLVEASISLERVRGFLMSEEHVRVSEGYIPNVGVDINNASFVYDSKKPKLPTMKKNADDALVKEVHDNKWEITLLKAQLEDAENKIKSLSISKPDPTAMGSAVSMPPIRNDESDQLDLAEELNDSPSDLLALKRINFSCGRGDLVAVVGHVGSGKSTFVNSILGEVRELSGSLAVKGRLALFPQSPFIMNASLQNNGEFLMIFPVGTLHKC